MADGELQGWGNGCKMCKPICTAESLLVLPWRSKEGQPAAMKKSCVCMCLPKPLPVSHLLEKSNTSVVLECVHWEQHQIVLLEHQRTSDGFESYLTWISWIRRKQAAQLPRCCGGKGAMLPDPRLSGSSAVIPRTDTPNLSQQHHHSVVLVWRR